MFVPWKFCVYILRARWSHGSDGDILLRFCNRFFKQANTHKNQCLQKRWKYLDIQLLLKYTHIDGFNMSPDIFSVFANTDQNLYTQNPKTYFDGQGKTCDSILLDDLWYTVCSYSVNVTFNLRINKAVTVMPVTQCPIMLMHY